MEKILTLDKPTTNLDVENISSLAAGICDIIESRKKNKKFQLIIITHDYSFLNDLHKRDATDHYWQVSKDDLGYSRLNRKRLC